MPVCVGFHGDLGVVGKEKADTSLKNVPTSVNRQAITRAIPQIKLVTPS